MHGNTCFNLCKPQRVTIYTAFIYIHTAKYPVLRVTASNPHRSIASHRVLKVLVSIPYTDGLISTRMHRHAAHSVCVLVWFQSIHVLTISKHLATQTQCNPLYPRPLCDAMCIPARQSIAPSAHPVH